MWISSSNIWSLNTRLVDPETAAATQNCVHARSCVTYSAWISDFSLPLHLAHHVSRVKWRDRLQLHTAEPSATYVIKLVASSLHHWLIGCAFVAIDALPVDHLDGRWVDVATGLIELSVSVPHDRTATTQYGWLAESWSRLDACQLSAN